MTRFEHVLAAIHLVLARYGNAAFPSPSACPRGTAQRTGHIGLFVNELPVAVALPRKLRDYALDFAPGFGSLTCAALFRHPCPGTSHAFR